MLVGGAILFPALGLLLRLEIAGRFQGDEPAPTMSAGQPLRAIRTRLLTRSAIACLIAGFGLLNVANADWAHAVGILCYFAFMVMAFRVIVFATLDEPPTPQAD